MSLRLRAEKGSTIRVETESGRQVAKATAAGLEQTIAFRAKTGQHTYSVTATDNSGNESAETTKKVSVDATAPELSRVTATAGTDVTGKSTVSFTSEPGARWTLAGGTSKTGASKSGTFKTLQGTVKTQHTDLSMWLPNGSYRPTLTVTDRIGNSARTTVRMKVHVKRPLLQALRINAPTADHLMYRLTGTPRSAGRLVLKNLKEVPFRIDDRGVSTIVIAATDGTYGPGRVTLTDFAGRQTSQAIPEVVVDTTAPDLELAVDQNLAKTGTLALTVRAEPGTDLHVHSDLAGATLEETGTATTEPLLLARTPAAGVYTVIATSQDAAGNQTTRQAQVEIVLPAPPADVALGLALLLFLCAIPVVAAVLTWRQRHRIRAWRVRRAALAQQGVADREAAAAEAAYRQRLAAHQQSYAAYQTADAAWQRDNDHLAALTRTAETYRPSRRASGLLALRRGELCFGAFNTTMVEERTRQGTAVLVDAAVGDVVITSQRVVFVGGRNREWAFDNLLQVQEIGSDLILLPVSNRKHPSGLRLSRSVVEQFRLQLDLAQAEVGGDRSTVIHRYRSRLGSHGLRRPVPPTPPARAQRVDAPTR